MCRGAAAWGGFGERRWAYAGERRVDLEELGMSGLGSDAALLEAEGVMGVGAIVLRDTAAGQQSIRLVSRGTWESSLG